MEGWTFFIALLLALVCYIGGGNLLQETWRAIPRKDRKRLFWSVFLFSLAGVCFAAWGLLIYFDLN